MKTFILAAMLVTGPALATPGSDGWITHPGAQAVGGPVVLHFRRTLDLAKLPKMLPVTVTADNRFILYVNGQRVATGPSVGTVAHWRTEAVDLAPFLHAGRNVVAAAVWDYVRAPAAAAKGLPAASALPPQVAPIHQQSVGLASD